MKEIGSGVVSAAKRAGKDAVSLTVALDGGGEVNLSVPASLYERLGAPGVGTSLSDTVLPELLHASEYRLACRHAIRILEYGDNNARTLRDKLIRKGVSREIAAEAVERIMAPARSGIRKNRMIFIFGNLPSFRITDPGGDPGTTGSGRTRPRRARNARSCFSPSGCPDRRRPFFKS